MTVDDRTRLNLHRKLEAVLGTEEADTLIAHLPPVTWHEVATKTDLRALEAGLRTEIAGVRSELLGAIAGVRTEMADLRTEVRVEIIGIRSDLDGAMTNIRGECAMLRTEFARLGHDFRTEISNTRFEMRSEIHQAITGQTRWLFGALCAWSALALTAARYLF